MEYCTHFYATSFIGLLYDYTAGSNRSPEKGETKNIIVNVFLMALFVYIGWGRLF